MARFGDYYSDFLEYLKSQGRKEGTIKLHRLYLYGTLSHSIQDIDPKEFKVSDIAKVIEAGKVHGKYGPTQSLITLRMILSYLEDLGVETVRKEKVKVVSVPQKLVEYLNDEEIETVRKNLPRVRDRVLIELLLCTGLRISEAISIDRVDIDFKEKEIKIVNCKNGAHERVYITENCKNWILRYLDERGSDDVEALFITGKKSRRISIQTTRYIMHCLRKNTGLKKWIHNHIFRKTYATRLLLNGVDIKTVQRLARHRSERTTLRYYCAVEERTAKNKYFEVMEKLI